jgi:hypothetical protein
MSIQKTPDGSLARKNPYSGVLNMAKLLAAAIALFLIPFAAALT